MIVSPSIFTHARSSLFVGAVRSILDDLYKKWSAGLDFLWFDETEDVLVDNMVRFICEGFAFRKKMFKGGLTANDLAWMRAKKKLKKKEAKEKNEKDPIVEVTDGEASSDPTF